MTEKKTNKTAEKKTKAVAATIVEDVTEVAVVETDAVESVSDENEEIKAALSDINKISDGVVSPSDSTVQVKKSKLHSTDKIPCKSLFRGKLTYISPTNGAKFVWKEYGAIQHIPLGELETMNNVKPAYLAKPYVIILEPTVVEDFNFGDIYKKVASFNKLGEELRGNDVDAVRAKVRDLISVGMRDSVIAEARKQRQDETLVNINMVKMLSKELKTDIE